MTNDLMVQDRNSLVLMPLMSIQEAATRRQALVDFTHDIMLRDIDYGKIPGTSKDTLLKPGAEKLTTFFGLSPYFEVIESEADWTGEGHGGEPFFYFYYRCILKRNDMVIGMGDGSCNTWEKKYRYRRAGIKCPNCYQEAVIKGRQEYGGGWLCFTKKGGCGSKWPDGSQIIEGQEVGQVKNENPADLVNTIQKMAQKRALVAATLIAVNASEFFTQDMEDYSGIIEGSFEEAPQKPAQKKQAAAKKKPQRQPQQRQPQANNGKRNGPRVTAAMLRELHALGTLIHKKEWNTERAKISKGLGKESSKDWSLEEYYSILEPLKDKKANDELFEETK